MQDTPVKLSQSQLSALGARLPVPTYPREALPPSILHIGVGGFHRAHQCVYLDDLKHLHPTPEWAIWGVGLLPHDARIRDALNRQDGLYLVVEREGTEDRPRVIGSIGQMLFAPENREAVLNRFAAPETRIVSLTITEGGYYVNQGTGQFDAEHPDIQRDLANPRAPTCSFGYLAEALDRRRQRGLAPFTLQSCDNLQNNGEVLKRMLTAFAELRDPSLANWISEHVAFPNSMVDRITPATTDEHRALVRDKFGVADECPVVCEPFKQWVIEDHFTLGRPRWEEAGAQITTDVLPYEKMKLRLLNAGHQAICYIGMLLGYQYAHEAATDPEIRKVLRRMMDVDVTPLLPAVPGIDLDQYKDTLIARFSNSAVRDQLIRIGTEGSARIPKFVLPSILEQLDRGGSISDLAFTVASWFRYLAGQDDAGRELPIIDPFAERLQTVARTGGKDPTRLLALAEFFGDRLPRDPAFTRKVQSTLASFYEQGARATLARQAEQQFA
ncbi:MAG TPA: mannitol dehydrogenase family protein [Chthoniobacterales bacterium]